MTAQSISPYELLNLIVSLISSVAVIGSLVMVYRQTRIFAKQTEYVARSLGASVSETLNEHSHEIGRLFIEYPMLRPYFYEGQDIDETHPDYPRAEAVAELILDIFWTMSTTAGRYVNTPNFFPQDGGDNLWANYVQESFVLSPLLAKTLTKRQNWYGQAMVAQMNEGLKRHAAQIAESQMAATEKSPLNQVR